MYVMFFENQPYFSQNSLQGENVGKENFWELTLLSPLPKQPSNLFPNPAISPEQLLNQPSMPKQPPNLLPNLAVSPEQLLNRPSHPTEQPEHLLNQPVFETNKPEQPNPAQPGVSTTKTDSRPGGDSLQQPELHVYSRSMPRIVETKMDEQCCQES